MPRAEEKGHCRISGAPTGLGPEKHPTSAAFHVTFSKADEESRVSLNATGFPPLLSIICILPSLLNYIVHSRIFHSGEIS